MTLHQGTIGCTNTTVLRAKWQRQRGLKPNDTVDVDTMSADFVNEVLFPPSSTSSQDQSDSQRHINPSTQSASTHGGPNSSSSQVKIPSSQHSSSVPPSQPETFKERIAHLLTDQRRFHAPAQVLERVHQFFKGPPQLDPAAFEGSTLDAAISIPFPDIMDTDRWGIPVSLTVGANGVQSSTSPQLAPIQSCFMHVPILPSKRRYETDTEVILLDDIRLAGQLNAKLWEEFSNGNVVEAISIVPTSATWFGKTELADWPCVVMSGLKFEQANGTDPSGKKYFEVHSYIAVYLGRDPLRQTQFVQMFQDLGISPAQNPESFLAGGNAHLSNGSGIGGQHHRWIAGFRRLFRTQGMSSSGSAKESGDKFGNASRYSPGVPWKPSDDEDSIDPQFDDIYSILPPYKKPRLERVGRPSDMRAAWHHNKRRKTEEDEFSKLKDPDLNSKKWGSDDDMSE
ncbi:hypothetical protein BGX20_003571 [Mortierella sp. AD010]|nr:hypothetical protein BGX20_003571 [Mortierella sp. AD010]